MSLFPAYSTEVKTGTQNDTKTTKNDEDQSWLTNSSFISLTTIQPGPSTIIDTDDDDNEDNPKPESPTKKHKHRKRKRDHSKTRTTKIEFTGNEEYFVDKKSINNYNTVFTLKKPACPRYSRNYKLIGYYHGLYQSDCTRYFSKKYMENVVVQQPDDIEPLTILDETEYEQKVRQIREILKLNPKSIDDWIQLMNLQDRAPLKCTKTQLAEKKLDIIDRALIHSRGDQKLYTNYIEILNSTYPSFEVSKKLELLIKKDPTNYCLWYAQILSTQGSMARCIVPDVLKLYEESMQKIFTTDIQDEILLKLFSNCAHFLRQSGLNEQLFALIKLALDLNTSITKLSPIFEPAQSDQDLLIEYEEVILKSGLPMNEIWLRIEKLRSNFNYLPIPLTIKCSDPQRLVFNEDICYFIYPLQHKEHLLHLILIILKLLKVPIIITSTIQDNFIFQPEMNDFDAIEDLLSIYLYQNITNNFSSSIFHKSLYYFINELVSSPSYIFTNIGSNIYLNTIINIILLCAECYQHNERINQIFLLIWLRLEKILIILRKLSNKYTNDDYKTLKTKIKKQLQKDAHRNIMNLYIEYALIEYECNSNANTNTIDMIFIKTIQDGNSQVPNSDFCYAYVCYGEIMIKENHFMKALHILMCYILNIPLNNILDMDNQHILFTESNKQIGFQKITERLEDLIQIENNIQIMELEQYYLPDYITNLMKMKIYYEILMNHEKLHAIAYLENLLFNYFNKKNPRSLYIREKIYEIYLDIIQWSSPFTFITNSLVFEIVSRALNEFPKNLYIIRTCTSLDNQPWYKLRALQKYSNTPVFVIFLIIAARNRMKQIHVDEHDQDNENSYKIRVRNLLKSCLNKTSILRKNALLWRIYIRCLCDLNESFTKVRNTLFTALDECPWNKDLYLDGAICTPQELPQLQDLLIEKQLRIYALPEELEILRNDNVENEVPTTTASTETS